MNKEVTSAGPSVGVLAYGSLIDDPGSELEKIITRRIQGIETPFPVEFARSSRTRKGAPTLVPHASGIPVKAELLVVDASVELATDILWRRETRRDGSDRKYPQKAGGADSVRVERLLDFLDVDVVLYTSIQANITPLTAEHLAVLAIDSVAEADPDKDGISYLLAAKKNGIVTTLSPAYEKTILATMVAADLSEALERARDIAASPRNLAEVTEATGATPARPREPSVGRRAYRFFTGCLVVYVSAVAIGRLLGFDLYSWSDRFRSLSIPYDFAISGPFSAMKEWFRDSGLHVPEWVRDVLVIWIVLGRFVRRSIDDMVAESEDQHRKYNAEGEGPGFWSTVRGAIGAPRQALIGWWHSPAAREKLCWTLFPPGRLWIDLRGKKGNRKIFWSLSPLMTIKYLLMSGAVLAASLALDWVPQ